MSHSKLNLDPKRVAEARELAHKIALDTQKFIDRHTTVTVERAVLRLLGVDGVDAEEVPLPNVVIAHLQKAGKLAMGAANAIGNAVLKTGLTPQQIAERTSNGELDLAALPMGDLFEVRAKATELARATVELGRASCRERVYHPV